MATLQDRTVSSTYKGVLNIDNSNAGIDGTIRYVQDGEGTASVLGLSTSGVTVNGIMKIGTYTIAPTGNITTAGAFTISGAYSLTLTLTGNTSLTLPTSGTFITDTSSSTLTNKIIDLASNTLTGTLAEFNTACSNADLVSLTGTETLTNKTLTAPIIATISNTGTLTLPTSTDTLVGRATTDTLTNKTLTSPKIGTSILDTNGNELAKLTATSSAVNEITLANAATGGSPKISATGDDTNIELHFEGKGSTYYRFNGTSSSAARLLLMEDTDNGTDGLILTPTSALTTTRTVTFPDTDISTFVVQRASNIDGSMSTTTTLVPFDNTVPQSTEGAQVLTQAITPKNSNNILVIDAKITFCHSAAAQVMIASIFQDTNANALSSAWFFTAAANHGGTITWRHIMTAGTTSSTTFKIRAGSNTAGTTTFNGQSGSAMLGGVCYSQLTITEYSA